MKFEIFRWDVVQNPCNNCLRPIAYFVPSMEFLNYVQKNNQRIRVNIRDSEYYDCDGVFATVDVSMLVPNCRPNFYDATQSLILYLDIPWVTYPRTKLGHFEVNTDVIVPKSVVQDLKKVDVEMPVQIQENFEEDETESNVPGPTPAVQTQLIQDNSLNGLEIGLIVAVIVLFVLLIFGIVMCFKNNDKGRKNK